MSTIKLTDIQTQLAAEQWQVLSTEYKSLDTEMTFECPEGHRVVATWKKMRTKLECPTCAQSYQLGTNTKVQPKKKGVRRTLALDQATHTTGYAIFDDNILIKYGSFTASRDNEIARCALVKEWLISIIKSWQIDYVGLEGIQLQDESSGQRLGVTVFQSLAHLQGILMETCYSLKIPYEICPTNTWRHACGVKGRTRTDKKKSMQLLVKNWYDVNISDDESDAIGIGHYLTDKLHRSTTVVNWET